MDSLRRGNHILFSRVRHNRISAFGAFVVEMGGLDFDDPVPINATFVFTIRTVERCLVRRLALRTVI